MTASEWANALAESIAADRPALDWIALADRVNDAMVADGYLMDSSAELQAECEMAARRALKTTDSEIEDLMAREGAITATVNPPKR